MHTYAVILVGGKGKRLRPLSSDKLPKPFLPIARDTSSLFQNTIRRIRRIFSLPDIVIVANERHYKLVKKDAPFIRRENIILEPISRNTAPALALAANALLKRHDDCLMVALPADHYIIGDVRYLASLKAGMNFVREREGVIVTLGVRPRYPSTEFGYLKINNSRSKEIYKVAHFLEKPNLKSARRYYKDRRYLWNTGAFIFKASTIKNAIKRFAPAVSKRFENAGSARVAYRQMPDVSIDYAVMEKFPRIYCVRGLYEWRDVGGFEILKEVLHLESRDFIEKDGKVVRIL